MKTNNYIMPSDSFVQSIDIHELLPQQEPYILVHSIVHLDNLLTVTKTNIMNDMPFTTHGEMQAEGLIEVVAQTCAARIGYINKYVLHRSASTGVVAGIKWLKMFSLPKIGEVIETTACITAEAFGMIKVKAKVKDIEGQPMMTGEFTVGIGMRDEERVFERKMKSKL